VGDDTAVESDVSATASTGGTIIATGYITAGVGASTGQAGQEITGKIPLGLNAAADTADILTVVIYSFTGSDDVSAGIRWREVR